MARAKTTTPAEAIPHEMPAGRYVLEVPVEMIDASPYQPRTTFPEAHIAELAESIRQHGIQQPVTVRPPLAAAVDGQQARPTYELIMGECRVRAARVAGLATVPALLRDCADVEAAELALVENVQRRDLTALEEAASFEKLLAMGRTQADLAEKIGKSQPYVANALRLLKLPAAVQVLIAEEKLSPAHGKALAKWGEWPAVIEAVAAAAVAAQLPSRTLDRAEIPAAAAKKLLNDKHAALLESWINNARADWSGCDGCAARWGAEGQYAPVCLRPDCREEKVDAHRARLLAEAEEKHAAVLTEHAGAVLLETLPAQREMIGDSELPTCPADCAHRRDVLKDTYYGLQVQPYCLNLDCLHAKEEARQQAQQARGAAEAARQVALAQAVIDGEEGPRRTLAWLLARQSSRIREQDAAAALAACGIDIDAQLFKSWRFAPELADALAALPVLTLMHLAGMLLAHDASNGNRMDEELAWFIGMAPAEEEDEEEEEDDDSPCAACEEEDESACDACTKRAGAEEPASPADEAEDEEEEPETEGEPLPQPLPEPGEGGTCATCAKAVPFNAEGVKCGIDGYFFDNDDSCSNYEEANRG